MLHRFVQLTFAPEHIPTFLQLFEEVKGKIKGNPGCISLQLLRDENQANVLYTYSIWESDNHLQAYRSSELFGVTWKKTKSLFEAPAKAWSTTMIAEAL